MFEKEFREKFWEAHPAGPEETITSSPSENLNSPSPRRVDNPPSPPSTPAHHPSVQPYPSTSAHTMPLVIPRSSPSLTSPPPTSHTPNQTVAYGDDRDLELKEALQALYARHKREDEAERKNRNKKLHDVFWESSGGSLEDVYNTDERRMDERREVRRREVHDLINRMKR